VCLSTQLELSKVFKSKPLVFAQFWPDFKNSTSGWSKTLKRFGEKYSRQIFVKNWLGKLYCEKLYWLAKNLLGMSDQLEILHTSKLPHAEKKPQNNFLVWGAHHCENGIWKIQIFCDFFSWPKYLMHSFQASVQLVPTFYSHPVCRLLELQLILASEEDCVQLVPKYYSKVKLRSWQPPNILSEIMRLLQNGGSGINLAQISNWPLLMGIDT